MNKRRVYNLEDRLIDFAVEIIKFAESLPKTRTGNHIAGRILRSGTYYPHSSEEPEIKQYILLCYLQEIYMKVAQMSRKNYMLSGLVMLCCMVQLSTTKATTYNLTVEADKRTQPWNRYYEMGVATCHMNTVINTYWGRGISNALKVGHDEAGFKYFRGHGILSSDVGLVDTNSNGSLKLNWTRFDSVYNIAMRAGLRPILEISTTPPVLASGNDLIGTSGTVWYGGVGPNRSVPNKGGWGRWLGLMDSIVTHCEKKWGVEEVRNNWYFEVWNEPTWWYMGFEKYIDLYDYTATGLKNADSLIRVGGPAAEGTNTITGGNEFQILLDHCHTGINAATKKTGTPIDFLTYHWYANNSVPIGIAGAVGNANNLLKMHKAVIDTLKKNYSWFKGPVFIDEFGVSSGTPVCRDQSMNASWIVKTVHLLNEGGPDYPAPQMLAHWALSDLYEEFQNSLQKLAFQEGNYGMMMRGSSSYQNSWDIPKPAFEAYRLLHKLGDFEIKSTGGTSDNGVNIISTIDSSNDSIQIMIYNHFASATQSSSPTDDITLTVNNIPWAGSARVEHFLMDTTHSNSYTKWVGMNKPSAPTNAQWDQLRDASKLGHYDSTTTMTLENKTFTKSFPAHYFSIHLIVISNPNATFVRNPKSEVSSIKTEVLRVKTVNGNIILNRPVEGQYTVSIFGINGNKLFETTTHGSGIAVIEAPRLAAGTYLLKCMGQDMSCVNNFFYRP